MNKQTFSSAWTHVRTRWLNVRRKRFWLLALLLLYTVVGFLVLPWLLRTTAIDTAREDYDRELQIAEVRTNPFTLTLAVDGLSLEDIDGQQLAGFDHLLVDFTLVSLFNWAWTFETIRLEKPVIHEERYAPGKTRFTRLVGDLTAAEDDTGETGGPEADAEGEGEAKQEDTAPTRLVIERFVLKQGRIGFTDHVTGRAVETVLEPLSVRAEDIDTRPERTGQQSVRVALQSGGTLDWQGDLQLVPFRSQGQAELNGIVADGALPYLREFVPLKALHAEIDSQFDYRITLPAGGPALTVSNLQAEVRDLAVSAFEPKTEFLSADTIHIKDGSYSLRERRVRIGAVRIDQPAVRTWLTPDGQLALSGLLPDTAGEAPSPAQAQSAQSLSFELAKLRVNGLDVDFEDRSIEPAAPIALRDVGLQLDGIDLRAGTEFATRLRGSVATGGTIAFDGKARVRPSFDLRGKLRATDLGLEPGEPWIQRFARVQLNGGALNIDGRLGVGADEPFAYNGAFAIDGLEIATAKSDDRLLAWHSLHTDSLEIDLGARRVQTSLVSIKQPFARVVIAQDRSTNIGRLRVEQPGSQSEANASGESANPFAITLGGIAVADGAIAFSDRSLSLPFATRIESLKGRVSTLSSGSSEPAKIDLEGKVADYGLARIDGNIDTWRPTQHTDLRLVFRNLRMSEYSPYSAEFAGRRIAEGKMDLDLAYRIDEGQLQASNNIVLRDLQLGEEIESPDAVSLPLGLAVALLKDGNGVIDVDLPVSGDVGSPEFGMGSVIRQALVTLIKKVVSSPFRLLGSLIGIDSEDLGRIEFPPGRSDLTPPQRERVANLIEALAQRPELALKLTGPFDPAVDRPALQRQKALTALRARLGEEGSDVTNVALTDKAAREAVRALFVQAYPEADLDALRKRFTQAPADDADGEPVFDAVAHQAYLVRRLIDAQTVTRNELESLASARSDRVRTALLAGGGDEGGEAGLANERVAIGKSQEVDSESGDRVTLEVGLATD